MSFNDLHSFEDLQFIPVNEFKQPIIKEWQTVIKKHDLSKCHSVGLVCGKPSGNLEAIDIDIKHDITGNLFERYKLAIEQECKGLLSKLVVQKTRSNGYHFIYRCAEIAGNLKLSNRMTTDEERAFTYAKTYEAEVTKGKSDTDAKKVAEKAAANDNVRVLIETRGLGGMIVCAPSQGYELIYGDFYSIQEITIDEREVLFSTARQLNEVLEQVVVAKTVKIEKTDGKSPFEDYNERGDVVALLQSFGWQIVQNKGKKIIFKRPGQTTAQSSGNFDTEKNWFSVFTTSTEFRPLTAYQPYAVFAVLECNGDYSLASKKLLDLGFGEAKKSSKTETTSTRKIYSRINADDDDFSAIGTPEDYEPHLKRVMDGTLPMGLTTGIPSLDEFFLFKEGNLVVNNGHDNSGKSVVSWYLSLLSAMYHGWTWLVFSSENSLGAFMQKMICFYWGKQLHGDYAMTKTEYETAKKFIENHFYLIKAEDELYNYKDILALAKKVERKAKSEGKRLSYVLVDPYNSLKIDLSGFSKLSTHEYHYEALSEIKAFTQKNKIGFWINCHAVTGALRLKDGDKKYPVAPQKADTEGGGKFANKASDFLTIHRLAQHPIDWNVTEIHVRKIKEVETGGRQTPFDSPIKIEMYKGLCGFREKLEFKTRDAVDPILAWHYKNGTMIEPQQYGQRVIDGLLNERDSDDDDDFKDYTNSIFSEPPF